MSGLRIPRSSVQVLPHRSTAPARQMKIDIVAAACAVLIVGGLVAYAAALALLARGLM